MSQFFCIKKEKTELIIDNTGYIKSLKYADKEYIGAIMPLFNIAFRDKSGVQTRINAFDMDMTSCEQNENDVKYVYEKDGLITNVSVSVGDEISWNISIDGNICGAVEWVDFPQIAVKDDFADNGGTSKVLWGFNEGTLIENMTDREKTLAYFEPEYPCKGIMGVFPAIVETQFMAYYNEESGMYIASHDADNNLKGINVYRKDGGVKLEYRHFTGCDFGQRYEMPYPMVIKFFHGDWHDASEIYRNWFKSCNKSEFIPIEKNNKLPDWYGESPVVITYPVRGRHDTDIMMPNKLFPYINVIPHVEHFEKAFGSKIMVLLMHWEGTAPWAPPVVWPPYGGEEELKRLIDELHKKGNVLGVYTSGLGWTINSNLVDDYNTEEYFNENNLKDEMCLSPEQMLPYSNICTAQRSGYDMCPTRDFTKNIVKQQVEHMVNAGIDYIQLMDQNHGGTSYFCYSQKHNHPPMPGKWQVDAVRELLKEIGNKSGKVLFGCESAAAESYISSLLFNDNRFNIAYYIGKPVPAYAYVYHEYINNFEGNQVCVDWEIDVDRSPESFYERIAYSFSAGDMLTAVINEDGEIDWNWGKKDRKRPVPNQQNSEMLIKNLNYWRQHEGKYLHSGKMIKADSIKCEEIKIWRNNGTYFSVPKVHTCAWEATDKSKAQFLINYSEVALTVEIELHDKAVLSDMHGKCEKLDSGKNDLTVPPFSAVMIKWN